MTNINITIRLPLHRTVDRSARTIDAGWDESKHKRDHGKFSSSGGSSSSSEKSKPKPKKAREDRSEVAGIHADLTKAGMTKSERKEGGPHHSWQAKPGQEASREAVHKAFRDAGYHYTGHSLGGGRWQESYSMRAGGSAHHAVLETNGEKVKGVHLTSAPLRAPRGTLSPHEEEVSFKGRHMDKPTSGRAGEKEKAAEK